MNDVIEFNGTDFYPDTLQAAGSVLADFCTQWHGPCKILSPRLDRPADAFANEIKFIEINVDESPALAQRFNIQTIPLSLFFKYDMVADGITGLPERTNLEARQTAFVAGRKNSTRMPPSH